MIAHINDLCSRARPAARSVAILSDIQRQSALRAAADAVQAAETTIVAANARDLDQARKDGLSSAMIDRLRLDGGRLAAVVADLRAVAELPDPVGRIL